MRLANDLAALALEHVRANLSAGTTEAQVAAHVERCRARDPAPGTKGKVENARGYALIWSFQTCTERTANGHKGTSRRCSRSGSAQTATARPPPGELDPRYVELEPAGLLEVYNCAVAHCTHGADLPELDRMIRAGIAEAGYPGQPSHPSRARRRRRVPYAHQAGSGTIRKRMVLAIEPGIYWDARRRPARRGQLADHGRCAREAVFVPRRNRARMIPQDDLYLGDLNRRALEPQRRGPVGLYDTTLRDGEQAVGVALDPEQKLEIARRLRSVRYAELVEAGARSRASARDRERRRRPAPRRAASFVQAERPAPLRLDARRLRSPR